MSAEPAHRRPSPWPPIMFVCFILGASAALYALLRDPTVKLTPRFAPREMVVAADGSALALHGWRDLELYSMPDYTLITKMELSRDLPDEPAVAWSANLSHVALSTGSGTSIEIRDARKDRYFRSLPSDAPGMIILDQGPNWTKSTYGSELVAKMAWSPDSRYLAILRYSGTVQVWDLQTNATISVAYEARTYEGCLAWSADSQGLLFSDNEGKLVIYSAPDFAESRTFESNERCALLSMHPNGKLLAQHSNAVGDDTIEVWHLGTMLRTAMRPARLHALAWHPTEEVLASASGGRLELWRPFDDEVVVLAEDDDDRIFAIAFSPDGRELLVSTDDDVVRALPLAEHAPALFP